MSLKFAVVTEFKGSSKDQVKAVNKMTVSVKHFGDQSEKSFRKASRSAKGFAKITKGILAANVIQKGVGALTEGLKEVGTQFVSFDDAITAAAVRFKDIGPEAQDFEERLQRIRKAARDAGADTVFTATQSSKALDFLARAGFTSEEAMGSLRSMINLSVATGEDFAAVADMSSDLLGAFGLAVKDSSQKIANLNRLNDVLVKSANSANVTVEDMFETMKVAAPIAVKFGSDLEEVAAMTAVMGSAGIKGSQGATALKNMFTRLSAPTKEVTEGLAELGLTQADLIAQNGKLKSMTDIMELIGKRIGKVAQPRQLGILKDLFGAFALAGGANLVESIQNVREFKKLVDDAAGTSERTADRMGRSLGSRISKLGSAFADLGFSIITPFETDIEDAITSLTGLLNKASEAVQDFAKRNEVSAKSAADNRMALEALNKVSAETGTKVLTARERFRLTPQAAAPGTVAAALTGARFGVDEFGAAGAGGASTRAVESLIDRAFQAPGAEGPTVSDRVRAFSRQYLGTGEDYWYRSPERQAPNQAQMNSASGSIETRSRMTIDFKNAPQGMTVKTESAPADTIDIQGLGSPAALQGL